MRYQKLFLGREMQPQYRLQIFCWVSLPRRFPRAHTVSMYKDDLNLHPQTSIFKPLSLGEWHCHLYNHLSRHLGVILVPILPPNHHLLLNPIASPLFQGSYGLGTSSEGRTIVSTNVVLFIMPHPESWSLPKANTDYC
jgi:hypothetical protein